MLFTSPNVSDGGAETPGVQIEPIMRLVRHIIRYKLLIVAIGIVCFCLVGFVLCFVKPSYQAEAVIIVDSRRNKLADAESALSSIVVDQYQTSLKSELELILSSEVARKVITSLDLLQTREYIAAATHVPSAQHFQDLRIKIVTLVGRARAALGLVSAGSTAAAPSDDSPAFDLPQISEQDRVMQNAILIFQKSFWAQNDPRSLTIRLGYKSHSPQLAAAITNAALREYLASDEETKAMAVERSEAWLESRITVLRTALDHAEKAVETFRASHNLASERDRSPLQQQLLQLSASRVDAEAALSAARAKIDRTTAGPQISASADALNSRLVQNLRQQEAALVAEQAKLEVNSLPGYPSVLRVAEQIARVRAALKMEIDRIGQSQSDEVRLAQFRLTAIVDQIGETQAKINDANGYDIKLRSLEADAAAKRAVLNAFTQRFDQNAGNPLTPPDSRVVSWANAPTDPISPRYGIVLIGGTFAGLMFGLGISLLLERLRSGFNKVTELATELGVMVAGLTVAQRSWPSKRTRLWPAGSPAGASDLAHTVRAVAYTPERAGQGSVVLVTSALPGEGKSSTALSLARCIAGSGQRCLLIDADIRQPALFAMLRTPAMPGFVELTLDERPFKTVVRKVPGEEFDFLAPGRPTRDLLSPFTVDAFRRALSELRPQYDVIVIDSAPVLIAAESLVLSGCADITLMLVKWRSTPRELARKAVQLLSRSSAGTCLAVLSQVNLRRMGADKSELIEARYRTAYYTS